MIRTFAPPNQSAMCMNRKMNPVLWLCLTAWITSCRDTQPELFPEFGITGPVLVLDPDSCSDPAPAPLPVPQPDPAPVPEPDYAGVPDYCLANVREQVAALRRVSPTGVADMLFITDTHYQHNSLASPGILSCLVRGGLTSHVVWGGDAITAYGDIPAEWSCHQRDFLGAVAPYGRYYMVRGNHEFTAKDEQTGQGLTYTQQQTATLLAEHTEPDVVRPAHDPESCYYYFDHPGQQLRYCVFDTTDSIASPSLPWCTLTHVSQRQLDWMDRHALHDVPAGYQLVVITHIGVTPQTYWQHDCYAPLRQLLLRAGAPVLVVLSGHMHQDFQTYDEGILHVLTGPDALYQDLNRSPFLHDVRRQPGHPDAPLMDLMTFSADRRMLYALRIGAGFSRAFHLDAVRLSGAGVQPLPELTWLDPADVVTWRAYDATGYSIVDARWDPPCSVLHVTADGLLQPLCVGPAVLMAMDSEGRKEFFSVIIDSPMSL